MFTKFIKKHFNFTTNRSMKMAGLLGAVNGRKAGQLFCKLEEDCVDLSKRTEIDKNELMDKTINLAKTTTLNFDEAFRSIERIVTQYASPPTLSDIAYQYASELVKTGAAWGLWKESMFRILNQPYRHMWE